MGKIYKVVVGEIGGEKKNIDLCNTEEQMKSMTVKQLKEKIAEKIPEIRDETAMRLIFTDKMLEHDSDLLSTYGIQNGSIVHLVRRLPGGGGVPHGMGDRGGRNASKEQLSDFDATDTEESWSCCIF